MNTIPIHHTPHVTDPPIHGPGTIAVEYGAESKYTRWRTSFALFCGHRRSKSAAGDKSLAMQLLAFGTARTRYWGARICLPCLVIFETVICGHTESVRGRSPGYVVRRYLDHKCETHPYYCVVSAERGTQFHYA